MDGQAIVARFDELDARKGTLKAHLQEVADFMSPIHANVVKKGALGNKRFANVYDTYALKCLRTFASGLYGNLMSAAAPWFEITCKDKTVARRNDVKSWLRDTSERMHDCLNESNCGLAAPQIFSALGWAGTACNFVEPGKENVLSMTTFNIGKICIMENEDKMIDTVFRKEPWTARRIIKQWPNTTPDKVHKTAEKNPSQTFNVVHGVFPREDIELFFDRKLKEMRKKRGAKNMPYASYYVLEDGCDILSESGYEEFPAMIPRWDVDDEEEYGRSPGMDALAGVKLLNELCKIDLKAMQKVADPPLQAPNEMAMSPIRLTPGGITYTKPGAEVKPLYVPQGIQLSLEYEDKLREICAMHFFLDLFAYLQNDDPKRTAYEIRKRAEQSQLHLGTALGRIQREYFNPLLSRVFWIMYRAGYIAPVPEVLVGAGLSIQYVSKLAMAMRMSEVQAVSSGMEFVGTMAQSKPEVIDNFDTDKMSVGVVRRLGVPEEFIRSEDDRDAIRQQRAADNQKAMIDQQLQNVAGAVPLSKQIEKGSPIDMIMNGGGEQ